MQRLLDHLHDRLVVCRKNKDDNYFNTSSGLFEQSLKEMKYIVQKFGGNIDTTYGLAGAGDLYVSILGGRNARLGFLFGKRAFI